MRLCVYDRIIFTTFFTIKDICIVFFFAASENLLSTRARNSYAVFVVNHIYTLLGSFIWSINMISIASRLWPDKFITFKHFEFSNFSSKSTIKVHR